MKDNKFWEEEIFEEIILLEAGGSFSQMTQSLISQLKKIGDMIQKLPKIVQAVEVVMKNINPNSKGVSFDFDVDVSKDDMLNVTLLLDYSEAIKNVNNDDVINKLTMTLKKLNRGIDVRIGKLGIIEVGVQLALKRK